MKFHIVRNHEKLENILDLYSITKDELKENNRHIRVWDKLIPGTKLKIPVITEVIDHDVMQVEPFIEDYYPKINYSYQRGTDEVIREKDEVEVIHDLDTGVEVKQQDTHEEETSQEILQQDTREEVVDPKKAEIMKEVAKYPRSKNDCGGNGGYTSPYYTYPYYYYPYQNPYKQKR